MDKPLNIPEMILISGSGRNSGKTTLAEEIIRYLSEKTPVAGIKTSPHFHKLPADTEYIFRKETEHIVIKEKDMVSEKDTSRMLRAGCTEAYLILAGNGKLKQAFLKLYGQFQAKQVIVCESPALAKYFRPGLFFFMSREEETSRKFIELPDYITVHKRSVSDLQKDNTGLRNIMEKWYQELILSFRAPS